MRGLNTYRFMGIGQPYLLAIRIGLLTAALMLLFQTVNLLVMYRYVRLDLYLCLVAVFFLTMGLMVNRYRTRLRLREKVTIEPESLASRGNEAPIVEVAAEMPKSKAAGSASIMELLSAKEWHILKLVAEGKTNKEIAAAQFIELSTVKTHLNNIYGKLSVRNRNEARAIYAEIAPKCPVVL